MWQTTGAHFSEYQGWLLPRSFGSRDADYRTLRTQAAMIDLSHRSKLTLQGKDRASFLHNFCTNNILQTPVGSGCEAFLLTHQAKILAWMQISSTEETIHLHAEPGLADKIIPYLDRYLITEQVEMTDRTTADGMLFLTGPAVPGLLEAKDLHHRQHRTAVLGTATVRLERNEMFGQPGFFVTIPRDAARETGTFLLQKGLQPVGLEAYEQLRVEAGVPAYGQDMEENHLPQEIDRTDVAISFTKGCYIGQETVARIRAYGHVNRLLRKLILPAGNEPPPPGTKLWRQGQEVGQITSAVVSSARQAIVALGFVRRGHQEPGTILEAETATGKVSATVEAAYPPALPAYPWS
jgi:folate-binding protein YgfZ